LRTDLREREGGGNRSAVLRLVLRRLLRLHLSCSLVFLSGVCVVRERERGAAKFSRPSVVGASPDANVGSIAFPTQFLGMFNKAVGRAVVNGFDCETLRFRVK
jgi:hypothetical protein